MNNGGTMKIKLIDILNNILEMDRVDIDKVVQAVYHRRNQLHTTAAQSFKVGDQVKFKGRRGIVEMGRVVKVNFKKIKVDTGSCKWNVPAGLLVKVSSEVTI